MPELKRNDAITGLPVDPSLEPAVQVKADLIKPEDMVGDPATAIADNRIEDFLSLIVEDAVNSTSDLYYRYRQCGFPGDAPERILKNEMRSLLMKPRVKDRLKYLREAEWELNQPTMLGICKKFEEIINEEELRPQDKIAALNSLAKIAGLFEGDRNRSSSQIAIIFNSKESPQVELKKS